MLSRKSIVSFVRSHKILLSVLIVALIAYFLILPATLFNDPHCTVILDKNNDLLGAKIAADGQWRFPHSDSIPEKFRQCILQFEDSYFYKHPGVNPVSLFKAARTNFKAGTIIRGGSTLTMQVIRLSRKGQGRTYPEKILEIILATRLEFSYSKDEILAMYCSNAPFGGNIVGLEAASWKYFGRASNRLTWAESATLAVLPNAPSFIHPSKNRQFLLDKRNRLLQKLKENNIIDSVTYELSVLEALPEKPQILPQKTYHLTEKLVRSNTEGSVVQTTIDKHLQEQVDYIVNYHNKILRQSQIRNAAALVIEVETGNVLAYVGNVTVDSQNDGCHVDIITAQRSYGSILKPFLYAAMTDAGEITPKMLIPDIPTILNGFSPKNYSNSFDGAVPAKRALSRSLNIPAVRMLRDHGIVPFNHLLKKMGMTTLNQAPEYYGLSIVLGGAEGRLWDIAGMYASCSRVLNHFREYSGRYAPEDIHAPTIYPGTYSKAAKPSATQGVLSAGAIWLTYQALLDVARPEQEEGWQVFSTTKKIAWKTGTSFGYRDAWAIGTTPKYVVGVWVGNADGEGRSGLSGASSAAPVMFDIFKLLPGSSWFDMPYDELTYVAACSKSGFIANENCEATDSVWIHLNALKSGPCPYHRLVHLNRSETFQVSSKCYSVNDMVHKSWFVLPPVQEWYYQKKNPFYKTLPPFKQGCSEEDENAVMGFIYPKSGAKIYIPINLDGTRSNAVFEVAHRKNDMILYWHLDGVYIGSSSGVKHQMAITADAGKHTVVVVDENANFITTNFEVMSK